MGLFFYWGPLGPGFKWTRPVGVRVQRVQKVQKVQRVVVGGCAANLYKTFTTALRALEMHPFCRLRRHLSTGKRLTRFSVACGSLRIVFACHPGGGGFSGSSP